MFVFVKPASAVVPGWNITGPWDLHFTATVGALGTYDHHMDVTQASDGTLSGTGYYIPAPVYTWVIDSGLVTGNQVVFDLHYTGGHPITWTTHVEAAVQNDGSLLGTWSDSDGNSGTVTSYSGVATIASFDWGSQVNADKCVGKIGKPVINITYKVLNDTDSGTVADWATDNYNRQVQVWSTGNGTFCVVGRYEGKFFAWAGAFGPMGTSLLSGDETGTMLGGRIGTFTGALSSPDPDHPRFGNIGTFDFKSTGVFSWLNTYFSGVGSSYADSWWGWIYQGGVNGTWINSIDGNFGNIQ